MEKEALSAAETAAETIHDLESITATDSNEKLQRKGRLKSQRRGAKKAERRLAKASAKAKDAAKEAEKPGAPVEKDALASNREPEESDND